MIDLDTLYLRFEDNVAVKEDLIYKGIKQAKELKIQYVKLFGNSTKDKKLFKSIIKHITDLNMRIELDIDIKDIDVDLVEYIKLHADLVKFGLNITPPLVLKDLNINYSGLLANLYVTNENIDFIPDLIDSYIYKYDFRRVKLYFSLYSLGNYKKYIKLVKYILRHYQEYGDKLYTAIPYVFLQNPSNFKLARTVCNYHKVVGLYTDGVVVACGINRKYANVQNTLSSKTLIEVIKTDANIVKLHNMKPNDLQGVCSNCVFKHYCGNICPANVYNKSGFFNNSFADCQLLYDKGLFPNEYLTN